MLKYLFALPLLIAATTVSATIYTADQASSEYEMHSHGSHKGNHVHASLVSTSFLLTPVSNTGYTLSATAVQQGRFGIDSSGTINLPFPGDYLVDFSLVFASDEPTRASQLNMVWNGEGVFQMFDSSNGQQVGTALSFNGTTLIHAKGPVTIQTNYENFGLIPTLVPLNGLLTVKKLQSGKSR